MKSKVKSKPQPVHLKYYTWALLLAWTTCVFASLWWNIYQQHKETLEMGRTSARVAHEKDVIYRRWNAEHGGVYAPVSEKTPPNPYLNVAERDITTPSGKVLTLINPAYMTRQVHEIAMKTYGVKGHITSLNPIRPENAPDPWETQALKAFQLGKQEISSVEKMLGEDYMRLMRPLITEKSCLKCHAVQGYKVGDIRGGISVSIPMAPLQRIERSHLFTLYLGHGLLWVIGLVGIGLGMYILSQQILSRRRAEEKLLLQEKLKGVIEMAGAVCHELNQPLQVVSGYSELLLMDISEDNSQFNDIKAIKEQIGRMGDITRKLMRITKYETKDYLKGKIVDIDKATG